MTAEEITYVSLRNTAVADSLVSSTAIFNNKTIATPPTGFGAITVEDFDVYINGRKVPSTQITSVGQNGANIEAVIDVAGFFEQAGAVFESTDEVILIGKFS
jgi:hypothetical protein